MPVGYKAQVSKLKDELPFIQKVALIEIDGTILYSSSDWNLKNILKKLVSSWNTQNISSLNLAGMEYITKTCQNNRLIASSRQKEHIIGVRNENRLIIAQIESDGIIPIAIMELSRLLTSIKHEKPYRINNVRSIERRNPHQITKKSNSIQKNEMLTKNNFSSIPFTARLMAHYRAEESKKENPLIIDPFAAQLAGNLESYFKKHIRFSEMDYPIIRTLYVEEELLTKWCTTLKKTQIVMLGAGLCTRAYRFKPLKKNHHLLFEIDLPKIIKYKKRILKDEKPLVELKRISADLSQTRWFDKLKNAGFNPNIPTFWVLEGLLYYLNREDAISLLKSLNKLSKKGDKIFLDLMQRSRWLRSDESLFISSTTSFTKHFKWGIDIKQVPSFFSDLGWNINATFADKHDKGRDVGQKAMIFVEGFIID